MKKIGTYIFILFSLFLTGCGFCKNSKDVQEDVTYNLKTDSAWEHYESVDDYGEEGEKAEDEMNFITSGEQGIHLWMFRELSYILYDCSQQTEQNLLSDYWVVEKITPIGSDYYNVLLHQKRDGARANLLFNPMKSEYTVLYIICDNGKHITYNGLKYMTKSNWLIYSDEYVNQDSLAMDNLVANPFFEIYESSIHTELVAALTTYLHTTECTEPWKVQEIYVYSSLVNYFLISEDRVVWLCLDIYTREFTVEAFYIEKSQS